MRFAGLWRKTPALPRTESSVLRPVSWMIVRSISWIAMPPDPARLEPCATLLACFEHPLLEPLQIAFHHVALVHGFADAVTFAGVGGKFDRDATCV